MRTISCALFTVAVVMASACGATTRSRSAPGQTAAAVLTGSTVSFRSLDHGKDANSQVIVQVLRSNNELGAEVHVAGTKFADNSQSSPMALSIAGPFHKRARPGSPIGTA